MGDEEDHTPVGNPQRAWLESRRSEVADSLTTLIDHFDTGETALGAGAWKGKAGKDWGQEFTGRVTDVRTAAQTVKDDLDTTIATMPSTVCKCQISSFSSTYNSPFSTFTSYPFVASSCSES